MVQSHKSELQTKLADNWNKVYICTYLDLPQFLELKKGPIVV